MAAEKQIKYRLLQGNEACAEGALVAGVKFCAGYPITPSTEIIEVLAKKMPENGGSFIQMEDEIASMAAVIGASLAGAKAMTATSGPGFSLKQENIGYAAMAEVPCVIINVMRTGPSTGLPTQTAQGDVMQTRWGTHGDHPIIVLSPANVRESYELTIRAFNLAEKYMTPVIVLLDEVIGHMRERVVLKEPSEIEIVNRRMPEVSPENYLPYKADEKGVPALAPYGKGYRYHVTGLYHDEKGFPTTDPILVEEYIKRLHTKIMNNIEDIQQWDTKELEDAEIAVFAYGSTARSAAYSVQLAREKGLKVGLFRPITLWPFPEAQIRELSKKVKCFIVPEQNLGQMVLEVERCAAGNASVYPLNQVNGELITPEKILAKIQEVAASE